MVWRRLDTLGLWIGLLVTGCGPEPSDGDASSASDGTCVGDAPLCDPIPGDCYEPPHATCEEGEWACPGFVFRCSESGEPIPEEPIEPTASSSSGGTDDTGTTIAEEGPVPDCEGDAPDCWDQGPGECADATFPANCVDAAWTCPPGWATGGFGPGCVWPNEGGHDTGDESGDPTTGPSDTGG